MIVSVWCAVSCGDNAEETSANVVVEESEASGAAAEEGVLPENAETGSGADGMEAAISDDGALLPAVSEQDKNAGQDAEISVSENTVWEEKPEPVKVKGIYVSGPVAGIDRMDELIALVDETELNAMVIDIKNDEGRVTYKMQSEKVMEVESGIRYIPDIEALVKKCKEKDIYLIARIVAFRDPYLAERKPEFALHTRNGDIFKDKNGLAWVNPYQREVWDYLVEIAAEAARAGFEEVQFDYIRFSTDIDEGAVDYGPEAEKAGKVEIITEFTEYLYEQLSPLGVYVAADVFGTVIDNEGDQQIVGQNYVQLAGHLDYICPMVYPSHYHAGAYGISVPDAEPYKTIYKAASSSAMQLEVIPEEQRAMVRLWLQSFTASWIPGHISYGREQIRQQIKGAYDAGYDEWILWNAAVNYQPDSLLTEEEAKAEQTAWEMEKAQQNESVSENDM